MYRIWSSILGCLLAATSTAARAGDLAGPAAIERFEKKVRPLLAARCWQCHGAEKAKGGLRLDSAEAVARGGETGPAVVAGKPEESLLIQAIRYHDDLKMPPKGKLGDPEVAELIEWVRAGAGWPGDGADRSIPVPAGTGPTSSPSGGEGFWAFRPADEPAPPQSQEDARARSPIDRFILEGLRRKGLSPAPPAERRALIRRATFDLTGLPPTPEEVADYLTDPSVDAFARVVDRLLASPRYGERWGRHWLDLARYSDSNGMDENMAYANAFRYRDYVVRSLNLDKPYDLFLKEQIAGDLLPPSGSESVDHDRLTATGFLVIGPKMLAEDDPVKMEMDIIDEQVDTVGRVFMGLTLGCARCHDHKFDPIPTADYYGLAGIFKSTRSMQNYKVVAMWNERSTSSKAEVAAIEAHRSEVARRKAEIDSRVDRARADLLLENRSRVADYLVAGREWDRSRKLRKSLATGPTSGQGPGTIVREAESFDRGNVLIDSTGHGRGIGVILNRGELPNHAEYAIELATEGVYQVETRHAAAEPRPVRLLVDGVPIGPDVAGSVTGSWGPEKQEWSVAGLLRLKAGRHTLRLESHGPFPHLDKLALVPRPLPEGVPASALRPLKEIADERALRPRLVERWADYLAGSAGDPESVFRGWDDRTPDVASVARQARDAFEAASRADFVELLEDPILAAYRRVLDDPAGPFSVPAKPEPYFPAGVASELRARRGGLAGLEKAAPPSSDAMSVEEQKATDLRIHIRGSHLTLGDEVPRRFPKVLTSGPATPIGPSTSGRLELANWLTRTDHPLTARVMVNRVWLGHFGEGLVRSPDNFGRLGERPDHPELLDWLARRFVESGWSIKAIHRLILLSSTYQMSTRHDSSAALVDPDNRLLWHFTRRRLEAESIRDAILAVSGELDPSMGGSLLPTKNHAYVNGAGVAMYESARRSVYLPVIRSGLYDVFQAFDFADPSASNGKRIPTTVAPQALFMMNDGLVLRSSAAMAGRLLARRDLDDRGRVRLAYESAYGRPPLDGEVDRAARYLGRFVAELEARGVAAEARPRRGWQALCQAIFASSEFVYLD